jgi:hypothetical protein
MMIGMGLFWVAVIVGIVWFVRDGVDGRQRPRQETPLTTLDRSFAEGALSLDDYHQRRNVLTNAAAPRPDQDTSSDENEGS